MDKNLIVAAIIYSRLDDSGALENCYEVRRLNYPSLTKSTERQSDRRVQVPLFVDCVPFSFNYCCNSSPATRWYLCRDSRILKDCLQLPTSIRICLSFLLLVGNSELFGVVPLCGIFFAMFYASRVRCVCGLCCCLADVTRSKLLMLVQCVVSRLPSQEGSLCRSSSQQSEWK